MYSIGAVLAEVAPEDWDALTGRADVYYSRGFVAASAPLAGGEPVLLAGEGAIFPVLAAVADPSTRSRRTATADRSCWSRAATWRAPTTPGAGRAACSPRSPSSTRCCRSRTAGFRVTPLGGTVAWALEGDLEAGMHAHHRRLVRRARASGLEAAATPAPADLAAFVAVYEETMRRAGAAPFYFFGAPYWEALLRDVPLVRIDVTGEDGLAASVLGMGRPPLLHYHLGGNTEAGRKAGASQLALLSLARWGQEHGYTTLHLGGGVGGRADSLLEYKRRFAPGGLVPSAIGKAVHDEPAYLRAAGADAVDWEGFFPAYREPR